MARWLYKLFSQTTYVLSPAPASNVSQVPIAPVPAALRSLASEVTCTHVHIPTATQPHIHNKTIRRQLYWGGCRAHLGGGSLWCDQDFNRAFAVFHHKFQSVHELCMVFTNKSQPPKQLTSKKLSRNQTKTVAGIGISQLSLCRGREGMVATCTTQAYFKVPGLLCISVFLFVPWGPRIFLIYVLLRI